MIRQIVRDNSEGFETALELEVKDDPTPTDARFLYDFSKVSDIFL